VRLFGLDPAEDRFRPLARREAVSRRGLHAARMGIRTDVVSVEETPVAGVEREALPSIAPEDVVIQRLRALSASGRWTASTGRCSRSQCRQ
jgi:hypothetical protein